MKNVTVSELWQPLLTTVISWGWHWSTFKNWLLMDNFHKFCVVLISAVLNCCHVLVLIEENMDISFHLERKWILKANFGWKSSEKIGKIREFRKEWVNVNCGFFSNFCSNFLKMKRTGVVAKSKKFFFNLQTHWKTAFSFLSLVKRTIIWVIIWFWFLTTLEC